MGGKKGVRTEYQPPADVLVQIQAFLAANPDFLKPKRNSSARRAELAAMSEAEANNRGCLAEKLNNEQNSLAERLNNENNSLAARLNEQYRIVPSAMEFIDPARLREAVLLTARSEAVQPLTPDQRADMVLSFYRHLSK